MRSDDESRADPLVRAGPPGPALRQRHLPGVIARRPTGGSAADQGVRPTSSSSKITHRVNPNRTASLAQPSADDLVYFLHRRGKVSTRDASRFFRVTRKLTASLDGRARGATPSTHHEPL